MIRWPTRKLKCAHKLVALGVEQNLKNGFRTAMTRVLYKCTVCGWRVVREHEGTWPLEHFRDRAPDGSLIEAT